MRRSIMILGLAVGSLWAVPVQAGWSEFWSRVRTDYNRMNCWPQPFTLADRDLVRAPFAIQIDNGWRVEHTLTEPLFNYDTQQLTRAGELKVQHIATQAPVNRRTIYVLRGANDELTSARVQSVQAFLATLGGRAGTAEVTITDIIPRGASAEYFDQIEKKARESVPEPRIPANSGGQGS